MKFTDRQVSNLKPKAERYEVWGYKGLGLRVSPSGTKSWIFMYRVNGRQRRMTLGKYPSMTVAKAHETHGKALLDVEKGIDPGTKQVLQNRENRDALTVNDFSKEYIEKWAKNHKKTWQEDERMLIKDVLPAIGRLKVKDVSRREIIKIIDDVAQRAPISANRTFEVVRKLFNFAVERAVIEVSPCHNIKSPAKENKRDRALTEEEILHLWTALEKGDMSKGVRLAIKLELVTAQRQGEIAQMEWSEVDIENGLWTIPSSKAKNGLSHRVPLSKLAIDILNEAREYSNNSIFVFPSPIEGKAISPGAITRAVGKNRVKFKIEHFTAHDLRRTAATRMASIGIPPHTLSKILNHSQHNVTAIYDRYSYDAEKREALDKWAGKLTEIINQVDYSTIHHWCKSNKKILLENIFNIRIKYFAFNNDADLDEAINDLEQFIEKGKNTSRIKSIQHTSRTALDLVNLLKELNSAGIQFSENKPEFSPIDSQLALLGLKLSSNGEYELALQAFKSAEYETQQAFQYRNAANKSAKVRKKNKLDKYSEICEQATNLIEQGKERKDIVGILQKKFDDPNDLKRTQIYEALKICPAWMNLKVNNSSD